MLIRYPQLPTIEVVMGLRTQSITFGTVLLYVSTSNFGSSCLTSKQTAAYFLRNCDTANKYTKHQPSNKLKTMYLSITDDLQLLFSFIVYKVDHPLDKRLMHELDDKPGHAIICKEAQYRLNPVRKSLPYSYIR